MDPATALVSADPLRLYTFSLSHFSEKIRWTLNASDIPFEERPWTPFFHVASAIRRGGKTTVPILETTGARVQDSTRILHWLEEHRAPFTLLPAEPAARDAVLAIEARFDRTGEHVVRFAYSTVLDDAESVIRYWTSRREPRPGALRAPRVPRAALGVPAQAARRRRQRRPVDGRDRVERRMARGAGCP